MFTALSSFIHCMLIVWSFSAHHLFSNRSLSSHHLIWSLYAHHLLAVLSPFDYCVWSLYAHRLLDILSPSVRFTVQRPLTVLSTSDRSTLTICLLSSYPLLAVLSPSACCPLTICLLSSHRLFIVLSPSVRCPLTIRSLFSHRLVHCPPIDSHCTFNERWWMCEYV